MVVSYGSTVRSEFENYVLWNKIVPYQRNVP